MSLLRAVPVESFDSSDARPEPIAAEVTPNRCPPWRASEGRESPIGAEALGPGAGEGHMQAPPTRRPVI